MRTGCFFIGHRDAPESVQTLLNEAIEYHIRVYNVQDFYVGHYGKFDAMAARAVTQIKKIYPEIKLILLLPYHPATHPFVLPDAFDESYYPFDRPIPPRYAIPRANKHMIDHCKYLITYVHHPGKSRDFLEYAQQKKMPV